jgi:hypothetical protein
MMVFGKAEACHILTGVNRPQDVGAPTRIPEEPENLEHFVVTSAEKAYWETLR